MVIHLSRESMDSAFKKYLERIFELPEIVNAVVRDITIDREDIKDTGSNAFFAIWDGYEAARPSF